MDNKLSPENLKKILPISIPALIFIIFSVVMFHKTIVINELMPSYKAGSSNDNRPGAGWIELYNTSLRNVDLTGWTLSYNSSTYIFPRGVTLKGREYKLMLSGTTGQKGRIPLNIGHSGKTLTLQSPLGRTVDKVYTGVMPEHLSLGRQPDGNGKWYYFTSPTPGKANTSKRISSPPQFSPTSGFYKGIVTLKISGQGNIYYTINGSNPVPGSPWTYIYKKPIKISGTTVIKAYAIQKKSGPSLTITNTYFINERHSMPVISLAADPDLLFSLKTGIFVEIFQPREKERRKKLEVPAHMEFFDNGTGRGFSINGGIRLHGQASLTYPQKSVSFFARGKYGNGNIKYPIFPSMPQQTVFEALLLRNGGNDWGNTTIRDNLGHKLAEEMGISFQASRPVIVFISGMYWGIYNLKEKINEHYLSARYDIPVDKIDILEDACFEKNCRTSAIYGEDKGYRELMDFIRNNDLRVKENYDYVRQRIDIKDLIKYLVLELYSGNSDWLDTNIKLWRGNKGKWRWLVYDMDFAFGLRKGSDSSYDRLKEIDRFPILFKGLFSNEIFIKEFESAYLQYLDTVFKPEHVINIIDTLADGIKGEMPRNIEKWKDPACGCSKSILNSENFKQCVNCCLDYSEKWLKLPHFSRIESMDAWYAELDRLKDFIHKRPSEARKHLKEFVMDLTDKP